jgi:ketosteroid isomerase-like protein
VRLAFVLLLYAGFALAQSRTPAEVVDAFHAALRKKDTAAALSLLDRGLVVFEFGTADPTVEAYAFRHLPLDMDVAVATRWKLETRRLGGEGNERWVLSTYHVSGKHPNGKPINLTMLETVILRRSGDAFRIVHLHWSTNDPAFNAPVESARPDAGGPPGSTRFR